ncbi:hypothetical protein TKK_0019359 [Trichogramma kaykai]|uniref:Luciferin 4-monooxygenase n=1 Tax=Trichogramma kaykai TaxID=54128 RepID=A0ABD2VT16_9HYME
MTSTLIRRILKFGAKLQDQLLKQQSRHASINTIQHYFPAPKKGEHIIDSPFGQLSYPEMPIHEYVWETLQSYSHMIATECGVTGRKYTYAQARDYSSYIARSLLDMGLKPGDVLAIILPNLPESPIAFLGCLEAGIVITSVNPIYTVDEISKQLISSGAKAVITSTEIAETVKSAVKQSMPGAKLIVVDDQVNSMTSDAIPFEDLIKKGKTLPVPSSRDFAFDNVAVLPYSSGTTGLPKGVMLSHRNIVANLKMMADTLKDDILVPSNGVFQQIIPVILPMYHIYGMVTVMLSKMTTGGKLITLPKFTPESYVRVLERNPVTELMLVPPIVLFLTSSKLVKKHFLDHVTYITSGAAPLSDTDVERFYEKFSIARDKLKFRQGYGMTESSPVSLYEKTGTKYSSIGRPICGCQARLVDPITKKDVTTPRQTGELWIRGPHVMKGYLNNQKATEETLQDGWLLTGDIAYFDEDSDFFITDRLKELIKVKGFQVAPAELEALIRTHPNVEEAGVVGIPDDRSGEVPMAFVVLKEKGATKTEEIQDFVKGKVSEFKELRGGVRFVDSLPKNPSGKILRKKLKALLE